MPTEPQLSLEQPRSSFGTWLGVVLLFAVFALVVWVVFNIMPRGDQYEEKRAAARIEKLKTASEEWNTALHTYGWVDKEKGIARIPIQRAMELTVAELAQKKPAPAGPIATPAAPAPAPAAAAPAAAPAPEGAAAVPSPAAAPPNAQASPAATATPAPPDTQASPVSSPSTPAAATPAPSPKP